MYDVDISTFPYRVADTKVSDGCVAGIVRKFNNTEYSQQSTGLGISFWLSPKSCSLCQSQPQQEREAEIEKHLFSLLCSAEGREQDWEEFGLVESSSVQSSSS